MSSDQPVGTHISVEFLEETCPVLSAGHVKHEYTTGYCQEEIFTLFGMV